MQVARLAQERAETGGTLFPAAGRLVEQDVAAPQPVEQARREDVVGPGETVPAPEMRDPVIDVVADDITAMLGAGRQAVAHPAETVQPAREGPGGCGLQPGRPGTVDHHGFAGEGETATQYGFAPFRVRCVDIARQHGEGIGHAAQIAQPRGQADRVEGGGGLAPQCHRQGASVIGQTHRASHGDQLRRAEMLSR